MFRRREFLGLCAAMPSLGAVRLPIRKGVLSSMFPKDFTYAQRFKLAREIGFEEIECHTTDDPAEVERVGRAAEDAKVRIHSVMNRDHWQFPLSSADPAVVAKSRAGMETSLRNAAAWKADAVLLVPAVVNAETGYREAWERSQREIRNLIPLAAKLKVVIAVENVWNKFLVSPVEFARYVDDFQSEWVKAYFDVGNVVLFGFPQDWIRVLGKRIVKLHLKDFRFVTDKSIGKRVADWTALREGEINWLAVHSALAEIGYKGTATVELPGGDAAYLKEVSRRVDLILAGEA